MDISASNALPASVQRQPTPERTTPTQEQAASSPASQPITENPATDIRAAEQPQKPDQPALRDTLAPQEKSGSADQTNDLENTQQAEPQNQQASLRETLVQLSVTQQQKQSDAPNAGQTKDAATAASSSLDPQEASQSVQAPQRNQLPEATADSSTTAEVIQEPRQAELRQSELRQSLEDKFSQAIGDKSNPPSIDLNV